MKYLTEKKRNISQCLEHFPIALLSFRLDVKENTISSHNTHICFIWPYSQFVTLFCLHLIFRHLIYLAMGSPLDSEWVWGFITPSSAMCGSAVENNIDCTGTASQQELWVDNCAPVSHILHC